jgi:hypothetical protein
VLVGGGGERLVPPCRVLTTPFLPLGRGWPVSDGRTNWMGFLLFHVRMMSVEIMTSRRTLQPNEGSLCSHGYPSLHRFVERKGLRGNASLLVSLRRAGGARAPPPPPIYPILSRTLRVALA